MSENKGVIEAKSFAFAIRIVRLYSFLTERKKEYVMSKQLLRSGTSIGANIAEAQFAQSKADFGAKMQISLEEAGESRYWIMLLRATDFLTESEAISILEDCNELINLLAAACKTTLPRN